jgi:cold shock CspA family protein
MTLPEASTPNQTHPDMSFLLGETMQITGHVIFYDTTRGFGFIRQDRGGEDVFVHVRDLNDAGNVLSIGDRVKFEIQPSKKKIGKFEACKVRKEESPSAIGQPVRFGEAL